MVDLEDLDYYIVGGAVRDELLGREPNDYDYVVVGHTPEEMVERGFETVVGESFPVFLHPETKDEWAMARTEEKNGVGYKGFEVQTGPDVTLKEDLERRDLTINAMAKDPQTEEIIDPHGGMEDLEDGKVRHVSEAFSEDPLRVIRAARFAARFNFEVVSETLDLMEEVSDELDTVDNKRIFRELTKVFHQADTPRRFFDTLKKANALDAVLPEIAELDKVPAGPPEHHAEGTTYEHTMRVLEQMHTLRPNDVRALFAALFHDVGKLKTPEEELPHHYKHEKHGVGISEEIAERLQMTNEIRGVIRTASRYHGRMHNIENLREATLIRMIDNLRDDYQVDNEGDEAVVKHITPSELVDLATADAQGREPQSEYNREHATQLFQKTEDVLDRITGEYIIENFDVTQGRKVGDLLLQERVRELKQIR